MSKLKYVWLLLCTWLTLCAAPPHAPGHSYSRNKRQGQQIALDFTLFSNSTTDCSAGLSNQGVSVAVSYRTFTGQGSSEWILMQPIIRTPATVCKEYLVQQIALIFEIFMSQPVKARGEFQLAKLIIQNHAFFEGH